VDNVKPLGLVIGAAVAMLLAGKPLSGSRGFGGLQYGLPKIGDMNAKVRLHAAPTCLLAQQVHLEVHAASLAVWGHVHWRPRATTSGVSCLQQMSSRARRMPPCSMAGWVKRVEVPAMHGRRGMGSPRMPGIESCGFCSIVDYGQSSGCVVHGQAESKAMVERRGKGLLVSLKQVNAVLRF
jgi:hypothetical protein